jgi:hypothetical protein
VAQFGYTLYCEGNPPRTWSAKPLRPSGPVAQDSLLTLQTACVRPNRAGDIMCAYLDAGGQRETTWCQVVLAWAADDERGLADAHAQFRFAAGG